MHTSSPLGDEATSTPSLCEPTQSRLMGVVRCNWIRSIETATLELTKDNKGKNRNSGAFQNSVKIPLIIYTIQERMEIQVIPLINYTVSFMMTS